MSDISYTNWASMSDKALNQRIGAFIKHHRLRQNKTQKELSLTAGISRSTLSLLERGESVNTYTLIQILRVLDLLHIMDVFSIDETISPIALAKMQQIKKRRVRNKKETNKKESNW